MAAIMFFIVLVSGGSPRLDPGVTHGVSRYGAIDGAPHGAFDLCREHAAILTKADPNRAYFCKELPELQLTPKAKPPLFKEEK